MKERYLNNLPFQQSEQELSLGVELELQVLDGEQLILTPRANELLQLLPEEKYKEEFFQSTLEIVTGVCPNVQAVEEDLTRLLDEVISKAKMHQLKLGSTGTHPLGDYRDRLVTPSPRYNELIDRNQWLIRRMAVYGMHIHIGMRSGDSCIRNNYFFLHLLPHLLSLSASSPFWQGMYTGLASCRPTTYEALPTAGMPYLVKDWAEFEKLYQFLIRSNAIKSMKDLWWDLRPSPYIGTLELRFCDEPATLAETLGIVAFVHCLAHWFRDNEEEWTHAHNPLKRWILRENKWRAIRFGLDADIVVGRTGKTKPLRDSIVDWLDVVAPYAEKLGYKKYLDTVHKILKHGNSASRQHNVFTASDNLMDVVKLNVAEFEGRQPLWN